MRILHVINSLDPFVGGPRENVASIGGYLASIGHTVEVASCSDTADCSWLQDYPVRVHPLGPGYLRYSYSPRLVPWLREHIQKFDAAIINGLWQYQGFGAYSVLRHKALPYFVYTHGMLDPWSRKAYPGKYLKKLLYWTAFEYRLLRDASGVFFTSHEESQLARQYFPYWKWKEFIVGAGIAAPPAGDYLSQRVLEAFPNLRDKRIVLFLGRIHEKKGLDLLIRALPKLHSEDSRLHLLIAGAGEAHYFRRLRNLAQELGVAENITWTGLVQGDVKWGLFRLAEVFALPSHQENFGISVVEALASRTPVLISNKVNIWREIHQDGAGFICDDNLESTIRELTKWRKLTNEQIAVMRDRALDCFRTRFHASVAARNVESAIEATLTRM